MTDSEAAAAARQQAEKDLEGLPLFVEPIDRAAARERIGIEEFLRPLSTSDFLRDYYGRSLLHLEGESKRWESVFGWPELNTILSSHRLSAPQLRLVREGVVIDETSYSEAFASRRGERFRRLEAGRVAELLRSGATLVLHAADDLAPSLSDLARRVEHFIKAPATVNVYATWGAAEGFNVHWDDHDVFAVQIAGSKRWQIFAPTLSWPLEGDAEPAQPPESPPVAEVLLDSGHLLYLPHGWWHVANTEDSPSLHLTIGVRPPSGSDLLNYVVARLRQHDQVRRRLPRFEAEGSVEEYVSALADLVGKTLNVQSLHDYLRYLDSQEPSRLAVSLPYSVEETAGQSVPADATLAFLAPTAVLEEFPDRVVLHATGRKWTFRPPVVAPLIRYLSDADGFTVDALLRVRDQDLSDAQVRALVGALIKAGIVGVV